jgi:glycosyltransferase involved in cell wall biosynthesis
MNDIRALFIGAILSPNWPGGEPKVARSLMEGFIQKGVEVKKISFQRSGFFNRICALTNPLDTNPVYCKAYEKILKRYKPDIVFSWFDYDTSAIDAALKARIPTVAAVHIPWPVCPSFTLWNNGVCTGPSRRRCYKHMLPLENRKNLKYQIFTLNGETMQLVIKKRKQRLNEIECIIVPSNFMKNMLIHHGLDGDKIKVIYNGISATQSIKPERSVKKRTKDILFIGPADEKKGYCDFVRMAKRLQGIQNTRFIAIGNSLSAGPVRAMGYVNDSEFQKILEEAYAVVFPSLWGEPFGLVAIEENLLSPIPLVPCQK